MSKRSGGLVVAIGAFKLVKAAVLVALGVGALEMLHRDVLHALEQSVGPDLLRRALAKLDGVRDDQLVKLGIASFVYAGFFVIEGIGLVLRKTWAEYLTIAITTSFIPLEIYELAQHHTVVRIAAIVLNLAIVGYLVERLHADHHWPFRSLPSAS